MWRWNARGSQTVSRKRNKKYREGEKDVWCSCEVGFLIYAGVAILCYRGVGKGGGRGEDYAVQCVVSEEGFERG
jgi:hypothetical protein